MKQHHVLFTSILGIVLLFGCKNDITPSLYDPSYTSPRPQPVIDSISPAGSVLAATTPITVYGKNFSTTPAENSIYFNGKAGKVQSATATQIICVTPADSGSVQVKVSVAGADKYSNELPYRLNIAVENFAFFTPPTNGAKALTPDNFGNIYFNLLAIDQDNGISILSPTGIVTKHSTISGRSYSSFKLYKDGSIYASTNQRALYKFSPGFPPDTSVSALFVNIGSPSGVQIPDIDFDQSGNLWAATNGKGLICVKQNKTFKISPFTGLVKAVRVYNGSLYFTALKDQNEQVFRAPINGDTLGTIETIFNITTNLGTQFSGQSMTISSDGYTYVGTTYNGTDSTKAKGIIVIAPGGASYSTPYEGYFALLGKSITSMAWGGDERLYVTNKAGNMLFVHTNKSSAPYYGVN